MQSTIGRKILRVFPRRTNATPDDELVRIGEPGLFDPPDCDEVHISVTFTWDRAKAMRLRAAWASVHPRVKLGGPVYDESQVGDRCGGFVPGRYLATGHVITSRGCPNRCWFCVVPSREGEDIRELDIRDGWKVQDSNLLACSWEHVDAVFNMLARQPHRPEFLGGLEAARLEQWHVDRLRELKPRRLFCAYDTPDDLEPIRQAGSMLAEAGIGERYCYVLIGYRTDSFEKAERRLHAAIDAGFMPYAMLFRGDDGRVDGDWRSFQREWVRPQIVRSKMREAAKVR